MLFRSNVGGHLYSRLSRFPPGIYPRPPSRLCRGVATPPRGRRGGFSAHLVHALHPTGGHPCGAGGPVLPVRVKLLSGIHPPPPPPSPTKPGSILEPCQRFPRRGCSVAIRLLLSPILCLGSAACTSVAIRLLPTYLGVTSAWFQWPLGTYYHLFPLLVSRGVWFVSSAWVSCRWASVIT